MIMIAEPTMKPHAAAAAARGKAMLVEPTCIGTTMVARPIVRAGTTIRTRPKRYRPPIWKTALAPPKTSAPCEPEIAIDGFTKPGQFVLQFGVVEHFGSRAVEDDPACVEDDRAVGQLQCAHGVFEQ